MRMLKLDMDLGYDICLLFIVISLIYALCLKKKCESLQPWVAYVDFALKYCYVALDI